MRDSTAPACKRDGRRDLLDDVREEHAVTKRCQCERARGRVGGGVSEGGRKPREKSLSSFGHGEKGDLGGAIVGSYFIFEVGFRKRRCLEEL